MGRSRVERPNFGDNKRLKNPKGQKKGGQLVKSTWKQQNQRGKKGVNNIDDQSNPKPQESEKKKQRYLSKKDKKKMEEEIPIEYVSSDFVAKRPDFEGDGSEGEDNL